MLQELLKVIDAFFESHGKAALVIRPRAQPLLHPLADLRVLVLYLVRERDVRFDPPARRGRRDVVVVVAEDHLAAIGATGMTRLDCSRPGTTLSIRFGKT